VAVGVSFEERGTSAGAQAGRLAQKHETYEGRRKTGHGKLETKLARGSQGKPNQLAPTTSHTNVNGPVEAQRAQVSRSKHNRPCTPTEP